MATVVKSWWVSYTKPENAKAWWLLEAKKASTVAPIKPVDSTNTSTPAPMWTRTDVFGDVSGKSTAWANTVWLKLSNNTVLKTKPTEIKDLWALSVFGEAAKQAETAKIWTLEQRNDIIAGNLVNQWKTDVAGITDYLMQQKWFKESSEIEKANTIRSIQERIGKFDTWETPTETPAGIKPWYYMKDWVETAILWYGDLDTETQQLIDWMSDADKKMLDMKWGNDTNAKAEYLRQAKREQEYQKWQRDLTMKIRTLEW